LDTHYYPEVVPARNRPGGHPRRRTFDRLDGVNRRARERYGTPQVTIEAILYSVRERGLTALKETATLERLGRCDASEHRQIKQRIARMEERGEIGVGKPLPDEATQKFVEEMSRDCEFQRIWQSVCCEFQRGKR
jgi:hypothetical protein